MPARTVSGNSSQAATMMAKSGSSGLWAGSAFGSAGGTRTAVYCRFVAENGPVIVRRMLSPVDACTEKVEAAGIAPAMGSLPDITQHRACVNGPAPCLHHVCTDLPLRDLVARWHLLTLEVREKIMEVVRGAS
jgi:hypothetical protein